MKIAQNSVQFLIACLTSKKIEFLRLVFLSLLVFYSIF